MENVERIKLLESMGYKYYGLKKYTPEEIARINAESEDEAE